MARLNLILLLVAVICALATGTSSHRARKLFIGLENEQKRARDLDVEWSQLQLEQSTWANHARVEKIARDKLAMQRPAAGRVVSVEAK